MNEEKVFGGLRDNASFCSHHLVFTAKKITIKPTLTLLILYSIFLVGGAGFLVGVLSSQKNPTCPPIPSRSPRNLPTPTRGW